MTDQRIDVHKVTKPIQLLAAWLVGLILVDSAFLITAGTARLPAWASGSLVVAAIINVPLFLLAIFLLQTRFRPEMQEDTYYAKYLESKVGLSIPEPTSMAVDILRREVAESNMVLKDLIVGLSETLQKASNSTDSSESEAGFRSPDFWETVRRLRGEIAAVPKQSWAGKKISLNEKLPFFSELLKEFSRRDIPVHETFGTNAVSPHQFEVGIGKGFQMKEIREIVAAVSAYKGVVAYAFEDHDPEAWDNTVLVGSYGDDEGISIASAVELLQDQTVTEKAFYAAVGYRGPITWSSSG
ncbi:MAG TPA: hypothetical protein VEX86_13255 [Longimicrobium sp.]|nr:hypothetical protein [Longimicrobium sp.]